MSIIHMPVKPRKVRRTSFIVQDSVFLVDKLISPVITCSGQLTRPLTFIWWIHNLCQQICPCMLGLREDFALSFMNLLFQKYSSANLYERKLVYPYLKWYSSVPMSTVTTEQVKWWGFGFSFSRGSTMCLTQEGCFVEWCMVNNW